MCSLGGVLMGRCPICHAEPNRWMGHEVRGVYDGVLYWSCLDCGHAWNRWAASGFTSRWEAAEAMVATHNDAVARTSAPPTEGRSA
jgi:hypothetical protein